MEEEQIKVFKTQHHANPGPFYEMKSYQCAYQVTPNALRMAGLFILGQEQQRQQNIR